MREKGRSVIYGLAGFYLLYTAYQMFQARMENGGSDYVLMIIFSIIFVVAGVGILGLAAWILKKNKEE